MQWSKWPCLWCSVNFNSKEAVDVHLQEQHQGCKSNGRSESEKVENNRSEEARTGLTMVSDGGKEVVSSIVSPSADILLIHIFYNISSNYSIISN
jgi:hypothetical protein